MDVGGADTEQAALDLEYVVLNKDKSETELVQEILDPVDVSAPVDIVTDILSDVGKDNDGQANEDSKRPWLWFKGR